MARSLIVLYTAPFALLNGCAWLYGNAMPESPAAAVAELSPKKIPIKFGVTDGTAADAENLGDLSRVLGEKWWEDFGDNRLNSLVNRVVNGNLELKQSYARFLQQDARYKVARADLWPELSISASADRSRLNLRFLPKQTSGFSVKPINSDFQLSIPASYEVDIWGRVWHSKEASKSEMHAAKEDYNFAKLSIIADVADTYFAIAQACGQLKLIDENLQSDRRLYELISARYVAGLAGALDVFQARQNLSTNLARQPQLDIELARAKQSLNILLGEFSGESLECEKTRLPEFDCVLPETIPATYVLSRPDVLAALYRLRAQHAKLSAVVASRFPNVLLRASGAYVGANIDEVFRPENLVWNLAVELGLTIIDGGRKKAREELEKAVLDEVSTSFLRTVLVAFKEVEIALTEVEAEKRRIQLIRDKELAVRNTLSVSTRDYLQGLSDLLAVLVARISYYNTQTELLVARRRLLSLYVQVARTLGVGAPMQNSVERVSESRN